MGPFTFTVTPSSCYYHYLAGAESGGVTVSAGTEVPAPAEPHCELPKHSGEGWGEEVYVCVCEEGQEGGGGAAFSVHGHEQPACLPPGTDYYSHMHT